MVGEDVDFVKNNATIFYPENTGKILILPKRKVIIEVGRNFVVKKGNLLSIGL